MKAGSGSLAMVFILVAAFGAIAEAADVTIYRDEWKTMMAREETIPVRGGGPVTVVFEYTRHNGILCPVVARRDGKAYVLCTAYMHDAGTMDEELYRLKPAFFGKKDLLQHLESTLVLEIPDE